MVGPWRKWAIKNTKRVNVEGGVYFQNGKFFSGTFSCFSHTFIESSNAKKIENSLGLNENL